MVIPSYRRHDRLISAAASLFLIAIIAFIDYKTGLEYELSIFYILPIILAAWYAGNRWGLAAAILSVAAWFVADIQAMAHTSSFVTIYWNCAGKAAIFILIVFLIHQIKNQQYQLSKLAGQENDQDKDRCFSGAVPINGYKR
jgi:hypothetical protein